MSKSGKNIAIAKFKRSKRIYRETFVFDNIDEEIKKDILSKIQLSGDYCVIVRYHDLNDWFLLSLNSLFLSCDKNKGYEQIEYRSIIDIIPNINLEELNKSKDFKFVNSIDVVTLKEKRRIVLVEPGTAGIIIGILRYFRQSANSEPIT